MSRRTRLAVDPAEVERLARQGRRLEDLPVDAPRLVADLQRQTQRELEHIDRLDRQGRRAIEQRLTV